jgi:dihydrofolate synthase / folylpolyglutamate synthase
VEWPARFQKLDADERAIIDGAHNADSIDCLVRTWTQKYPGEKASIVFGLAANKDVRTILRSLQPIAARWFFTEFESQRAAPAEQLNEALRTLFGEDVSTSVHATPKEAIAAAKTHTDRLLITGSLYLAGEVLAETRGQRSEFRATMQ